MSDLRRESWGVYLRLLPPQSSLWPRRRLFGLLQLAGAVARAREQPSQTRRERLETIAVCVKPMTTRCEACELRQMSGKHYRAGEICFRSGLRIYELIATLICVSSQIAARINQTS